MEPVDRLPRSRDGLPAAPRDGVEKLAKALDTVRVKLAEVATKAHEVEVENVAIVD